MMLETKDLTVKLGDHFVIEKVSIKVEEGDFYSIIGPNGGGKSVLLKTLLGIIKPFSGEILTGGNVSKDFIKRVGYVPQFIQYDKNFPITAFEVAMMGRLRNKGLGKFYDRQDEEKVKENLAKVRISEETSEKSFSQLSGGQIQKVLIARALASDPELIILDEPTASVDAATSELINKIFADLNKKGITIILVTHDIGAISKYITKVACLNRYLHTHNNNQITADMVKNTYGCDIDLIGHGVPHRVLEKHN